jgi:hypothetical protein
MLDQLKQRVLKPTARPVAQLCAQLNPKLFASKWADPASRRTRTREPIPYPRHSVQDPEGLLHRPAEPVTGAWGGRNPRFYNYDSAQIEAASSLAVHRGAPGTSVFHDVVYVPQYECLYTTDGVRIDESCLRRRRSNMVVNQAPEKIAIESGLKRFSQRVIYAGGIAKHFGHFLTEGLARYWYAIADESCPILSHPIERYSPKPIFLDHFFGAIHFSRDRLVSFKRPILLVEVVVPRPAFVNSGEAFEVHRLLPENVAAKLLPPALERTSQPLYMSRRLLDGNKRQIIHEDLLEERLRARGFQIVYPERLSLEQQVHLINKHDVLVGTLGSALHGILFDVSPVAQRNMICLSYRDQIHPNYLLIDAIKSVNSTYVGALERIEGLAQARSYSDENRAVDLDVTFAALKDIGLL